MNDIRRDANLEALKDDFLKCVVEGLEAKKHQDEALDALIAYKRKVEGR